MSIDGPPTSETRNRRRLAMAAAAVVAVLGVAAIAINLANSEDDGPSPVVATVLPPRPLRRRRPWQLLRPPSPWVSPRRLS